MKRVLKDSLSKAFDSIQDDRYQEYLQHFMAIAPQDSEEVFKRFLFSFLSVQINWELNVKLYQELENYDWSRGEEPIKQLFIKEGVGFQNTRPRFIHDFATKFHEDSKPLLRGEETWQAYRARLNRTVCGLAIAKLSFTAEMYSPDQSSIVCLDRHMLREVFLIEKTKYGISCNVTNYKKYEQMWVKESQARGMAPAIARLLYWDQYMGYEDSLFWSKVFVE